MRWGAHTDGQEMNELDSSRAPKDVLVSVNKSDLQ